MGRAGASTRVHWTVRDAVDPRLFPSAPRTPAHTTRHHQRSWRERYCTIEAGAPLPRDAAKSADIARVVHDVMSQIVRLPALRRDDGREHDARPGVDAEFGDQRVHQLLPVGGIRAPHEIAPVAQLGGVRGGTTLELLPEALRAALVAHFGGGSLAAVDTSVGTIVGTKVRTNANAAGIDDSDGAVSR